MVLTVQTNLLEQETGTNGVGSLKSWYYWQRKGPTGNEGAAFRCCWSKGDTGTNGVAAGYYWSKEILEQMDTTY
jgi:hypothetical protein